MSQAVSAQTYYYRATFNDDPSTSVNIGWSADRDNDPEDFTIYWGCTDHGQDVAKYEYKCKGETETRRQGISHFFKKFSGLSPKTVYYFVIKDEISGELSPRMSVMTLSDDPDDPISFISGGDTRTGGPVVENCNCRKERQRGNRLVSKIRPDVIFFNGDYVLNRLGAGATIQEWKDWFQDWELAIGEDGRLFPLVVSLGNHEDKVEVRDMFNMPSDEMYFGLNFHGNLLRLYTLNSEVNACNNTAQLNWLKNDLEMFSQAGNDTYWKFAQFHIPMIPQGHYSPKNDIIDCWMPLFEEHGIRLVMESHTHIYKVTHPIKASSNTADPTYHRGYVRSDGDGVMFIGEGNWGAPYRTIYPKFAWTQDVGRNFSSFFFITVNKEKLTVQTVEFDTDIDAVTAATDDKLGSCLPAGISLYEGDNGPLYELCANGTDCLDGQTVCGNGPSANTTCDTTVMLAGCEFVGTTPGDTTMNDTTMNDTTTGIIQNLNLFKFAEVYPNPVKDVLTVEFNQSYYKTTIEIYSALGHLCNKVNVDGKRVHQFNVENDLCDGVNFIFIRNEDGIQTHKIIKK